MNQANLVKINGVYVYEFNKEFYFTQAQLASMLGLTRENVSRRLKRLVKRGFVDGEKVEQAYTRGTDGKLYNRWLYPLTVILNLSYNLASQDEVLALHPLVENFLDSINWEFEHHVPAPEYGILDFLATDHNGDKYIIECKRDAKDIDSAIRQVKNYGNQYNFLDEYLYLIIALPKEETNLQLEQYLQDNGILLWAIEGYKRRIIDVHIGANILGQLMGKPLTEVLGNGFLRHELPIENID